MGLNFQILTLGQLEYNSKLECPPGSLSNNCTIGRSYARSTLNMLRYFFDTTKQNVRLPSLLAFTQDWTVKDTLSNG